MWGPIPLDFTTLKTLLYHITLPVTMFALGYYGEYHLIMRSSLTGVMKEDYVLTAQAKGLTSNNILWHHVVPNAMLPTVSLVMMNLGFIVSGAILVESVFNWPGIGLLSYQSMAAHDYPVMQAVFHAGQRGRDRRQPRRRHHDVLHRSAGERLMPRQMKRWIVVWTPVVWLALELIKYPKSIPLSSGLAAIVKGFFAPSIGNFPPQYLLLAAVAVAAWGTWLLFGRARLARLPPHRHRDRPCACRLGARQRRPPEPRRIQPRQPHRLLHLAVPDRGGGAGRGPACGCGAGRTPSAPSSPCATRAAPGASTAPTARACSACGSSWRSWRSPFSRPSWQTTPSWPPAPASASPSSTRRPATTTLWAPMSSGDRSSPSSSGAPASRWSSASWRRSSRRSSGPPSASPPATSAAGPARSSCASPTPSSSSPGCPWRWCWRPPGATTTSS